MAVRPTFLDFFPFLPRGTGAERPEWPWATFDPPNSLGVMRSQMKVFMSSSPAYLWRLYTRESLTASCREKDRMRENQEDTGWVFECLDQVVENKLNSVRTTQWCSFSI